MTPFNLPNNWRDLRTADELLLTNQWSMWGDRAISKVGSRWDSKVPSAPLFKTKREAFEYLSRFVCDMIPFRCAQRAGAI